MRISKVKTGFKRLRRSLPSLRDWLLIAMGVMLTLTLLQIYKIMNHATVPLAAQAAGINIPWLPPGVQRWKAPLEEMGRKYDIDANLLAIIMTVESGGFSKAHSEADAQGLMQITPPTATDIAAKFLQQPRSQYNLYDPRTNIEFGTAYLAHLRDTFGSERQGRDWNATVELIAAGYNGGPGAASDLEKGNGLHSLQTAAYSRDVYNMWRERHAPSSPTFERWAGRGGSTLIDRAKNETPAP